ncbi:FG-GAP-like repeat-containing protein [Streptomyces sp. NRRL S-920]|uniref:FG-GAP-like repeat-containing protein n=1 Tax=Streptomyces sp. NRRL S-920 TaxID=1463921 RepID=UPI0004CB4D4C|nr:FG-GAP-like repeat-containing protein [Streptomyces sp. NRRL S-920]
MPRSSRTVRLTMPLIAASLLVGGGLSALTLGQASARAAAPATSPAASGRVGDAAKATDDFNGDGYGDLVVGAPGGTVSGKAKAGYVVVTYGSKNGLGPARKKVVSRSTSGVPGAATAKEEFGGTFTKGDLDRDGFADLVIGVSGRSASEGSVILWGSASGLTGGTRIATFGRSPQAGDFDGDGTTDLALFAGVESYGDDPVGQQARLWKGPLQRTGTPAKTLDFMDRSEWWDYGSRRPDPTCADRDCVDGPRSLSGPSSPQAVGDLNGDSYDDLAMVRYSGDGEASNGVLYGSPTGFTRGDAPGAGGDMAVGDINGDGYDDLALGNVYRSTVRVAYGSASGLKDDTQVINQDLPGVPGAEESGDAFGASVAVGDVTGDGYADLAVGVTGEDVGSVADAGAVVLVHGSADGVTGAGAQVFHQNTAGVPGVAEKDDTFGSATALLDVTGDGHRDLAVSSVRENAQAGALWSLRGTATGVTATGSAAFGPKDVAAPAAAALFGSELR